MKEKVFRLPNAIIQNSDNLHPSTISVAQVFYANMGKHRKFTNCLANIAAMSFKCVDTVRQAVEELVKAGYIKKVYNFIYSDALGKNIYARTTYCILKPVEEDYTFVPYAWLKQDLTPCTMQVLLTCRMFMIKSKTRSYPSLRKISALIRVSKSTVCNALACIAELGILLIEPCQKENKAYSSNSYHMIHHISDMNVRPLIVQCITQTVQKALTNRQERFGSYMLSF